MNENYIGSVEHISEVYEALDTVRSDTNELSDLYEQLGAEVQDYAEKQSLIDMIANDQEAIADRRVHVLKSLGGITINHDAKFEASMAYIDSHDQNEQDQAAHRAYYYNVMIDAASVGQPLGTFHTGKLVSTAQEKEGQTIRLHGGRPDLQGRGMWYNPVAPRTVEVVGAATGHTVLDTYPAFSHKFDSVSGENRVTAGSAGVQKEYVFADNSEEYRMGTNSRGESVLEHIMPINRRSIFEYGMLAQRMLSDARNDEAAEVAIEAAGGPQRSIYETYDTTTGSFNPVPVSVGKTQ